MFAIMSSIMFHVVHPTDDIVDHAKELLVSFSAQLDAAAQCSDTKRQNCILTGMNQIRNLIDNRLPFTDQGIYDAVLTIEFETGDCEATVCCDDQ